jgi:hypothetical protein
VIRFRLALRACSDWRAGCLAHGLQPNADGKLIARELLRPRGDAEYQEK